MMRVMVVVALAATCATAQVTFDLSANVCTNFPVGCDGTGLGDPEGVACNGVNAGGWTYGAVVDNVSNGFGFPVSGAGYARVRGAGPTVAPYYSVPLGGPAPEPAPAAVQMTIPIPAGSDWVTFYYQYVSNECVNDTTYNDGFAVEVVDSACSVISSTILYADTSIATVPRGAVEVGNCPNNGGSFCAGGERTIVWNAPLSIAASLGAYPVGSVLRVKVWNAGDNGFSSTAMFDEFVFGTGPTPPAPPVPPPDCILHITGPLGPGSIQITNTQCPAQIGNNYIFAVTFLPGVFPNGWWYGLDIAFTDLVAQYLAGFPFVGALDGAGSSNLGPIGGLPSGFTLWAVTAQFTPGFGLATGARPPVTFTIP